MFRFILVSLHRCLMKIEVQGVTHLFSFIASLGNSQQISFVWGMGENGVYTQSVYINTSATTFVSSCTMEVWIATVAASSPPLLPLGKQSPKQNCKEWGVWQGEQGKEGNILDVCIYVHMCSQCCIVFFGYPDWTVPNEPEFQMYNNLLFSLSPIACLGNTFQSSSRFLKVSFHSRKSDFRVRVYTFKMYINVFIVFFTSYLSFTWIYEEN